jgi:hypothetical protein
MVGFLDANAFHVEEQVLNWLLVPVGLGAKDHDFTLDMTSPR